MRGVRRGRTLVKWISELVELRDQILHPLVASLLPWHSSLRYAHALSRRLGRLGDHAGRSRSGAAAAIGAQADAAFARRALWVRLLDLIDAPLSLLPGDRHLRRHWRVLGQWPDQPCLVVSLHYGNGMFPMRHFRLSGQRAHMILERVDPVCFKGRPLSRWIAWFRRRCVERAMGGEVIFSGGARRRCLDALAAGDSIFALLDNPQGLQRGMVPVQLFGRRIALHTGILELARSAAVPVVPMLSMVGDGRRREIHIGPVIDAHSAPELGIALAQWFAPLVESDTAAWHFWPHLQQFEQAVSSLLDANAAQSTVQPADT
jgi:hypothetical protein